MFNRNSNSNNYDQNRSKQQFNIWSPDSKLLISVNEIERKKRENETLSELMGKTMHSQHLMKLQMEGLDPGLNRNRYNQLQNKQEEVDQTQEEYQLMVLKHNRDKMYEKINYDDTMQDEIEYERCQQYLYELNIEIHQYEEIVGEQKINRLREPQENEFNAKKKEKIQQRLKQVFYNQNESSKREWNVYDAQNGFNMNIDFVSHVPKNYKYSRLQYGIFNKGSQVEEVKVIQNTFGQYNNHMTVNMIFNKNHQYYDMKADKNTIMVFELQLFKEKNHKLVIFGWSMMELFDSQSQLLVGKYRIPFYSCEINPNILIDQLKNVETVGQSYLYLRVHRNNAQEIESMGGYDLREIKELYFVPFVHRRAINKWDIYNENDDNKEVQGRWLTTNYLFNKGTQREKPQEVERDDQLVVEQEQKTIVIEKERIVHTQLQIRRGLMVQLVGLKNYFEAGDIKLKVALSQNTKILKTEQQTNCQFTSGPHNITISLNEINLRQDYIVNNEDMDQLIQQYEDDEPEMYLEIPGSVWIDDEYVFFTDLYYYAEYFNCHQDIYLVIQLFSKKTEKLGEEIDEKQIEQMSNEWFGVGWQLIKVFNSDNVVDVGRNYTKLLLPPIQKPPLDHEKILIEGEVYLDYIMQEYEYDINSVNKAIQMMEKRRKQRQKDKYDKIMRRRQLNNMIYDSRPFIKNLKKQYIDKPFEKGFGIDFYIDCARFLPDNVTVLKVELQIINVQNEEFIDKYTCIGDINSFGYNPQFNFRQELRAPHFDPTIMAIMTLITIDNSNKEIRLIGYSCINLFRNRNTLEQPDDQNDQNVILNNGCYQLPIYCQEPYKTVPFSLDNFVKLDRLPCSSLLIRIYQSQMSDDGLRALSIKDYNEMQAIDKGIMIKQQSYGYGQYNTSYYSVNESEMELFPLRQQRADVPINEHIKRLQSQFKVDKQLSGQQMFEFVFDNVNRNTNTEILDLVFFAKYQQSAGFKVSIDGFHYNIEDEYPLVTLVSLNPPGGYYLNGDTKELVLNMNYNWDSPLITPQYNEGYFKFRDIKYSKNTVLIIEIYKLTFTNKLQNPKLIKFGFTILPLFTANGYVKSGQYQLPIIKQPIENDVLQRMQKNDPLEVVNEMFTSKTIKSKKRYKYYDNMTVIVRLLDSQREGHYQNFFDVDRLSYKYLPEDKLSQYVYNRNIQKKYENSKKLISISPLKFKTTEFNQQLVKMVYQLLNMER